MRMPVFHSVFALLVIAGCVSSPPKPDWVSGPDPRYPSAAYLVGIGEGGTRKSAEDAAYGAVSRIFVARIDQRTREWESYLQQDSEGRTTALRSIEIRQVTAVSTRKILEDVRIAEVWRENFTGRTHALAVLDRARVSDILRNRIEEMDSRIRGLLSEADPSKGKLRAAGNLYRAVNSLLVRETYNTDLQIVSPSGQGIASPVSLAKVTQDFHDLIRRQLNTVLRMTGTRSDAIRSALLEGLARYGFSVGPESSELPDLLIQGVVDFQTVPNPKYELVRWTAEFEVSDPLSGKILGSFSKSGREGHLSLPEAENRAVRALQSEAVHELSDRLADFIFGEVEQGLD
jgi:hypothetical protein